jgi:glycosyltransferase involved in cell wall biosynthesis
MSVINNSGEGDLTYHQLLGGGELGGAALVGLHIADHLKRLGRQSQVWLPGEGPAWREAQRLGLTVRDFDATPAFSPGKFRAATKNWEAARALRKSGPGLVHVHSPCYYGALRWGLRLAGLKQVVHVQLREEDAGLRWAFRTPPELIITCARFLVDLVRRTLPHRIRDRQRIVAVPNAVDCAKFFPGEKGKARERVHASAGVPLALMLANLAPHKGQETAIRAVAHLKHKGVDMACWLAGVERGNTTVYTARLKSLIAELGVADRVKLLGQRTDAPDLLRAADFFLLPSTCEGLPLSVLEAQASGVPVLAAPTDGIPEVVRDGVTGFLVAAGDAAGYAHCLENLLDHPELGRKVAEAAQERTRRENNWENYCQRVSELYEDLVRTDVPGRRWGFFAWGQARQR